jgi:DNA processing protein
MKDDLYYYLGFSHCLGIGPIKFQALIKHFGTVKGAYHANIKEIQNIVGAKTGEKFLTFRSKFDPVKKLEELQRKNISVISIADNFYPQLLKQISDAPICLYVRGDFDSASASSLIFFAIVGTRTPTPYGEQIAKKFANELAQSGFIIVSGMAMGIDTIAHKGALEVGGKTIAVLGCGVDIIYPAMNARLYQNIIEKNGLIISEFPPGHTVLKGLFIARNRIISGLSKGVLIVEGLKDSGALITARYAAEQGREVFATPAPITSPFSQAPNLLLKQGAKLVTTVEDIVEELGLKILPKKKEEICSQLNNEEKIIFKLLQKEPLVIDEIAIKAKQSINETLNLVSLLEIKGVIEKNSEGKYQIRLL